MPRSLPSPTIIKGVLAVSWPFLSIIVFLVLLSFLTMDTLSSARAFVAGESLWTKGQKEAVQQLEQYVHTGERRHYLNYQRAIAIPSGDHDARMELEKPMPDLGVVTAGLALGGNDPRDFDGMIRLFRYFRTYSAVAKAVDAWRGADTHILELMQVATRIDDAMTRGDQLLAAGELEHVHRIDQHLGPLERQFSQALGEASRQAETLLRLVTLLSATALVAAGFVRTRRGVASERAMAASLKASEARQKLAIMASQHGLWDLDAERSQMHISPNFMAALGYRDWPDLAPLSSVLDLFDKDDRASFEQWIRCDDRGDSPSEHEYRLLSRTGETRWIRVQGAAMREEAGGLLRLAGAMRDITEQKLAKAQLFKQKALALVTLQSIREAVITTDADGCIDYMNPGAETLLKVHRDEVHGAPVTALCRFIDETSRQDIPNPVDTAIAEARPVALTTRVALVLADGTEIPVDASSTLMCHEDGSTFGTVLVLRDVREERASAARITFQATHDPLTGLINRSEFERLASAALEQAHRDEVPQALMFLDLDQFKIVNDTCGHRAGDELLRQVARLMTDSLRKGDTLARLGGDEFGALLQGCALTQAAEIAETLRDQVSRFRFYADGRAFSIGISIGVAEIGADFDDLSALMRAADEACYLAKEKGRNRVQTYQCNDSDLARQRGMMQWNTRIRDALDRNQFQLYAQPIEPATPRCDRPLHFEVLLRLREADGELITPSQFLPAAERYGLIHPLDRWVVMAAFQALQQARVERGYICSINLSAASLGSECFAKYILALAEKYRIDPARICFEVTETSVISEIGKAQAFIESLRERGFRFALDDFGSGMASFGYLKHLPIDYLKIDGAFVRLMLSDRTDRAMVDSINKIGRVFGVPTIAEFVENEATRVMLQKMGVDYVQGYGVGPPLPLEELLARHMQHRPTITAAAAIAGPTGSRGRRWRRHKPTDLTPADE